VTCHELLWLMMIEMQVMMMAMTMSTMLAAAWLDLEKFNQWHADDDANE